MAPGWICFRLLLSRKRPTFGVIDGTSRARPGCGTDGPGHPSHVHRSDALCGPRRRLRSADPAVTPVSGIEPELCPTSPGDSDRPPSKRSKNAVVPSGIVASTGPGLYHLHDGPDVVPGRDGLDHVFGPDDLHGGSESVRSRRLRVGLPASAEPPEPAVRSHRSAQTSVPWRSTDARGARRACRDTSPEAGGALSARSGPVRRAGRGIRSGPMTFTRWASPGTGHRGPGDRRQDRVRFSVHRVASTSRSNTLVPCLAFLAAWTGRGVSPRVGNRVRSSAARLPGPGVHAACRSGWDVPGWCQWASDSDGMSDRDSHQEALAEGGATVRGRHLRERSTATGRVQPAPWPCLGSDVPHLVNGFGRGRSAGRHGGLRLGHRIRSRRGPP